MTGGVISAKCETLDRGDSIGREAVVPVFLPYPVGAPWGSTYAIWIYSEVLSELKTPPDHDFRTSAIKARDAVALAWESAADSLKREVSSPLAGLAWLIVVALAFAAVCAGRLMPDG